MRIAGSTPDAPYETFCEHLPKCSLCMDSFHECFTLDDNVTCQPFVNEAVDSISLPDLHEQHRRYAGWSMVCRGAEASHPPRLARTVAWLPLRSSHEHRRLT